MTKSKHLNHLIVRVQPDYGRANLFFFRFKLRLTVLHSKPSFKRRYPTQKLHSLCKYTIRIQTIYVQLFLIEQAIYGDIL